MGTGGDASAPPDGAADSSAPTDTGTPTDGGVLADAGGGGALVVNEIRASDGDWIELHNTSATPIDVGNYRIADSEDDGGVRLSRAAVVPAGTTIAPGGYLFVLADQPASDGGFQTACLDGGPSPCLHSDWGISASNGETIHVVNAAGAVVAVGTFPPNATPAGQTWGRLPNGTGAFAPNRPTPGAANQAP